MLKATINYPDDDFITDLSNGMPIVGTIPDSNTLRKRVRTAKTDLEKWKTALPALNRANVQRVTEEQDSENAKIAWERTLTEVERGWVSKPIPLNEEIMETIPLTPRFAKREQHGNQDAKFRLIDDFKASAVNDLLSTVDTAVPQTLDLFLATCVYYSLISPNTKLLACSMDFAHAYKHIGIPKSQRDFATIILTPPGGPVHYAKLHTQPFGSSRAPANWGRVTHFLQEVMLNMFDVVVFIYVDDCFIVEPHDTLQSAWDAFHTVCQMLGLSLEPAKGQPPARKLHLLGADIALTAEGIHASFPDRKRHDLLNDLKQVLKYNQLNPAQAAKLRGRLGFAQSFVFGKLGRALLHPLTARQYSQLPGRNHPLNEELNESLRWWIALLTRNSPRTVPFGAPKPTLLYTDASGSGHISAVLLHEGVQYTTHTHLPPWFTSIAKILEFEMVATILGMALAYAIVGAGPVLLCCDNQGADGIIIRGTCQTDLSRTLSSVFWQVVAANNTPPWVEYVASPLNLADHPSRLCPGLEKPLKTPVLNHGVPAQFHAMLTSIDALNAAKLNPPPVETDILPPWECNK